MDGLGEAHHTATKGQPPRLTQPPLDILVKDAGDLPDPIHSSQVSLYRLVAFRLEGWFSESLQCKIQDSLDGRIKRHYRSSKHRKERILRSKRSLINLFRHLVMSFEPKRRSSTSCPGSPIRMGRRLPNRSPARQAERTEAKLRLAHLEPLAQRVTVRYHLKGFDRATGEDLKQHLNRAGIE